jgi:hypothetical protein
MVPAIFKHVSHQFPHQKLAGIGWMQKNGFGWRLGNSNGFQNNQTNVYRFKKPFSGPHKIKKK